MRLNDQQKQEIKTDIQQAKDKYTKDRKLKANIFARRIVEKIYYKKYKIDESGNLIVNLYWWQFDENYVSEVSEILEKEGYHFSMMWTWWFAPIHTIYITLVENDSQSEQKSGEKLLEEWVEKANNLSEWEEIWQAFAKADNTEEYCWIYMWYKDGRVTKTKIYKDIKPLHKIEEIDVEPIEWNEKDFGQKFLGKRGPKWAMNSEGKFTVGGK